MESYGETYYTVSVFNKVEVYNYIYVNDDTDNDLIKSGNHYRTKREAKVVAEKIRNMAKIKTMTDSNGNTITVFYYAHWFGIKGTNTLYFTFLYPGSYKRIQSLRAVTKLNETMVFNTPDEFQECVNKETNNILDNWYVDTAAEYFQAKIGGFTLCRKVNN